MFWCRMLWLFILVMISLINGLSVPPTRLHQPIIVAGATGYIGRQVVKELVRRGEPCIALVRSKATDLTGITQECLRGADIVQCDVLNAKEMNDLYQSFKPTSTVCCLASRSGVKADSWAVDYGGGKNLLDAKLQLARDNVNNEKASSTINGHYVLLSAYCCGKPSLQYQFAKLKLEEELKNSNSYISHSIVRPTAFFKSLDGQVESARKGLPLLYFGSGDTAANAICAEDLARLLVDCALQPDAIDMLDNIRDVGGPDVPPISKKEQLSLIYETLGIPEDKRLTLSLPVGLIDTIIATSVILEKAAGICNAKELQRKCEDAAEIARIVKYYATEPMVAVGNNQVHGSTKLVDHFQKIADRGGELEEIDKMTTTTGVLEVFAKNDYARQQNAQQEQQQ